MEIPKTKIDLSEVKDVKLKCIEYCGKCCFFQAPILTTSEINRILAHIKTKCCEESEAFALDWLSYLGRLPELTKELLSDCIESLKWFWSPFQLEEAEEGILVRNYTIHSMPSSGRCKLLNPNSRKCFVYPTRPNTCRLYPFAWRRDSAGAIIIELGMENCPGITKGRSNLDREEIKQMIEESFHNTKMDILAYEKYIADNNIKKVATRSKKRKRKLETSDDVKRAIQNYERHWRDTYFFGKKDKKLTHLKEKKKRFIEPLAELGLIPKHPIIVQVNETLKQHA